MRRLGVLLTAAVAAVVAISVPVQGADGVPASHAVAKKTIVATATVGTTVRGRRIIAHEVGDPDAKHTVVLMGAIHGDERGPSRILRAIVRGRPIAGADIWIIRVFNRDGAAADRRTNAHHVDLNRNFPVHWKRLRSPYYSGSRPASEPETRALMRFLKKIRPDRVVSFHQPLHGVGRSGLHRGRTFQRKLSRRLGLPLRNFDCNGGCHGTMTDWFNARFPGVAITVEYGPGMTRHQLRTGPRRLLRAVGAHYR